MPKRADKPDIEIGASLKAKKLRFEHRPEVEVRDIGDSSTTSERKNLPEEVEPGETYRDVELRKSRRMWVREERLR